MREGNRKSKNRSEAARRAHRTREKEYSKIRRSLLILDCTAKKENRSEGKLVFELMRILDYDRRINVQGPIVVRKKSEFGKSLEKAEAYSIHISSHGYYDEKGSYFALPFGGKVYASDLEGLWKDRLKGKIPKLIALSACYTGRRDLIEAFSRAGCRYCIAPSKDPWWHNAALFWSKFYTVLFLERRKGSPWIAFRNTKRTLPKVSRNWKFFERGEEFIGYA